MGHIGGNTSAVIWRQNTSMMMISAWFGSCNDLHCSSTYGTTLINSVVLLKWLGLTLNENESGHLNRGKLCMALPAYMSCIGRKSSLTVTLRLSAKPAIGTHLHPFSANLCRPDGMYIFYYLCFLSRTLTIHRAAGEEGDHLYRFHRLHRHLDISRVIAAESSPLHIASSRTQTEKLQFPDASL